LKNTIQFISAIFSLFAVLALAGEVFAGSGDNVTGWAWSENVGWINANSSDVAAVEWAAKGPSKEWMGIAMSADGKHMSATTNLGDYIYVSHDYGETWIQKGSPKYWRQIDMSADGRYQTAVAWCTTPGGNDRINISSDYGDNWSAVTTAPLQTWQAVAMSDDGQHRTACSKGTAGTVGQIYVSHDSGATWTAKTTTAERWTAVAMSGDGLYQTAVEQNGKIYSSNDYGNTWNTVSYSFSSTSLDGVGMSNDGKYQTVVGSYKVYRSSDYGVSWNAIATGFTDHTNFLANLPSRNWQDVAVSNDGKTQTIVDTNYPASGTIYTSIDNGVTWAKKFDNGLLRASAMSGNGNYQVAAGNGNIHVFFGGSADYGINIASDGLMSGYAWSENVGWISFNEPDLVGCPEGVCTAQVDMTCPSGKCPVSGWARVLSAKDDPVNAGGWNGWIKLSGANYGWYIDAIGATAGDFHGYAFGDDAAVPDKAVVGWVSANCKEGGATANDICAQSSYKLHTSVSFVPTANMACGGTCTGGKCDAVDGSTWEMYPPVGDCPTCMFSVTNISTGNVQCTKWELVGTAYNFASDGKQNLTFQPNVPTGTYSLKLTVSDRAYSDSNPNCTLGNSNTKTHQLWIKKEVEAAFECSFDNPVPTVEVPVPDPLWQDCESIDFKKKVVKGEVIYLRDRSTASEGAAAITTRNWEFTIDGAVSTATGDSASFTTGKANTIDLTAYDNYAGAGGNRHNCKAANLGAKTLPKWQEVSPVGMIREVLLAGLVKVFGW